MSSTRTATSCGRYLYDPDGQVAEAGERDEPAPRPATARPTPEERGAGRRTTRSTSTAGCSSPWPLALLAIAGIVTSRARPAAASRRHRPRRRGRCGWPARSGTRADERGRPRGRPSRSPPTPRPSSQARCPTSGCRGRGDRLRRAVRPHRARGRAAGWAESTFGEIVEAHPPPDRSERRAATAQPARAEGRCLASGHRPTWGHHDTNRADHAPPRFVEGRGDRSDGRRRQGPRPGDRRRGRRRPRRRRRRLPRHQPTTMPSGRGRRRSTAGPPGSAARATPPRASPPTAEPGRLHLERLRRLAPLGGQRRRRRRAPRAPSPATPTSPGGASTPVRRHASPPTARRSPST